MTYDIYDTDTANLVGSFANEAAALATVRRVLKEAGPESIASWALAPTDLSAAPLAGAELVERALLAAA